MFIEKSTKITYINGAPDFCSLLAFLEKQFACFAEDITWVDFH